MSDKTVIYSKQSGEPDVPLTLRIDWLPDGTIKPRMYWTPDDSCYQVISIQESVSCAFLKDKGVGMRYKVMSEIVETPELDELLHTQYESYIYLADNRFCEKSIIDERYKHSGKEYIPVTMDVFPDGDYELVYFWYRGDRYMVEKTLDIEPRGSFRAGGVGLWHKVRARLVNADDDEDPDPAKSVRRMSALYLELNKWFVSVANTK